MLDLLPSLVAIAAALASVVMVALTCRWAMQLGRTEAKIAEALGVSAEASRVAHESARIAEEAREHASRRADAIAAQYGARTRKRKEREREAERDADGQVDGAPANSTAAPADEIAQWWATKGRAAGA